MRRLFSTGVVFLGFAGMPASVAHVDRFSADPDWVYSDDPRLTTLKQFFRNMDSPAELYCDDFIEAADLNNMDWRLLPSIAFVESGGGKQACRNNWFGWDNGRAGFSSVRQGIHLVANRLTTSKIYRQKDLDQVLRIYNPHGDYPRLVRSVMLRISASTSPPLSAY